MMDNLEQLVFVRPKTLQLLSEAHDQCHRDMDAGMTTLDHKTWHAILHRCDRIDWRMFDDDIRMPKYAHLNHDR